MTTKEKQYKRYLNTKKWKDKRIELFNIRGEKCEKCGSKNDLHIHHLTYENIFNEKLEDLQILCKFCHKAEHNGRFNKKKDKKTQRDILQKIKEKYMNGSYTSLEEIGRDYKVYLDML